MLSKRYESAEVDRRTWLHDPSLVYQSWHSPSSLNIKRDFYKDVYTILKTDLINQYGPYAHSGYWTLQIQKYQFKNM